MISGFFAALTSYSTVKESKNLRAHGAVLVAGVLFGSTFVVMKHAVARAQPEK